MAEIEVEVAHDAQQPTSSQSGSTGGTTRKRRNPFARRKSEEHSRKPLENKWLQQQIPACRPVFTAIHAFVGFLIIGVAFLILGAVFTAFSARLRQFEVSYDGCGPIPSDDAKITSQNYSSCEDYLRDISQVPNFERLEHPDCHCTIDFTLPEDIRPPWNFYYGMRNYYQNHRRYLNSWDVEQLRGNNFRNPTSDCRPFVRIDANQSGVVRNLPVVPCGLIANSWFNDSFDSFNSSDDSIEVLLIRQNIAWDTDRSIRFQNPGGASELDPGTLFDTTMPPNWPRNLSEVPQGLQNESLMVWFRVSAFPWFRKLYARPAVNGIENAVLPQGDYSITLTYNYPVSAFNGKKSIILAEVNWLGGRNMFMGIAYLVVGAICVVTAFFLLILHKFCSKWKLNKAPFSNGY